MKSFSDKVAIVTGASSGIGLATARLLHREGAKVVLAARNAGKLEAAARELPGSLAVPTDVTRDESVAALAARTLERFGRIDLLVNDAGILFYKKMSDSSAEENRAMMETNYFGAVRCTDAVLPAMRRQGGGNIVNVASIAGLIGFPRLGYYGASKFALVGYSHALRQELKKENIRVSVVCPGTVETPMTRQIMDEAVGRGRRVVTVPTEAVARAIMRAARRDLAEVVLPFPVRFLRGLHFFAPSFAEWLAGRFRAGGD